MKLIALIAGALLLITGCSAAPSDADITERFELETAGVLEVDANNPHVKDIAEILSRRAAEDCDNAVAWRVMSTPGSDAEWEPNFQYIWAASCGVLYGDSLDPALREAYRQVVVKRVLEMNREAR